MKGQAPIVSICLPVLNGRGFIGARIDSIQAQTYARRELIVCDGGSTDGTWEFLECATPGCPSQIFRRSPDGIYAAINACIQRTQGKYVYIATADDTMTPDCLESMVSALENNPDCGICHCALRVIDAADSDVSQELQWLRSPPAMYFGDDLQTTHFRHAPHDGMLAMLLKSCYVSLTQLLIRRDVFKLTGCFEQKWGSFGDLAWSMRAGCLTNTVHIPKVLATWRRHPAQASQYSAYEKANRDGDFVRMAEEAIEFLRREHSGVLGHQEISRILRYTRLDWVHHSMMNCHGHRQELRMLMRMLRSSPGLVVEYILARIRQRFPKRADMRESVRDEMTRLNAPELTYLD